MVDQVQILETMTPLDFMDFRSNLSTASGFQSLQFRLIENKLGVKQELRTNYGKSYYIKVFEDEKVVERVLRSEREPSLLDLIESWLERTPGLEEDGFDFWGKYKSVVNGMIDDIKMNAEREEEDKVLKEQLLEEAKRKKELFDTIFDVNRHNQLKARGERRFSHKALQGKGSSPNYIISYSGILSKFNVSYLGTVSEFSRIL